MINYTRRLKRKIYRLRLIHNLLMYTCCPSVLVSIHVLYKKCPYFYFIYFLKNKETTQTNQKNYIK